MMTKMKRYQTAKVTPISAVRTRRLVKPAVQAQTSTPVRKFVPFNGFDGQYLAGSGALVFEGELLERMG